MNAVTIITLTEDKARFSSVDDPDDHTGTSEDLVEIESGETLGMAVFRTLLATERDVESRGGIFFDWCPSHESMPAFIDAAKDLAGSSMSVWRMIRRAERAHSYVQGAIGGVEPWAPKLWLDGKSIHEATKDVAQYVVDCVVRDQAEYARRQLAMFGEVSP